MVANIIFPAPSAVYVASLYVPLSAILALATEFGVYVYFQRGVIRLWRLFGVVLGVNIFSWLIGLLLSLLFPSFLVPQLRGEGEHQFTTIGPGPHWTLVAVLSFVWACFLSTLLEYCGPWLFRRKFAFQRLGLCVATANVAGYLVAGAVVWSWLHFNLDSRNFWFGSIFDILRGNRFP